MPPLIGRDILRYAQVTSTNDLAREFADAGQAEGLVITAEEQTAGRGRLGRKWIVPAYTSLQLSVLLRPPLAPPRIPLLTQMAALAITSALRNEYSLAPTLKWHNDVLLKSGGDLGYKRNQTGLDPAPPKKCAGILVETSFSGDQLQYAILGIGINVNFSIQDYPDLAPNATTIADALGHPVDRRALERGLLSRLDDYYTRLCKGENFRDEYRAQLSTLGHQVRVESPKGLIKGLAEDVDDDGALLVISDGNLTRLLAGDVTVLKD